MRGPVNQEYDMELISRFMNWKSLKDLKAIGTLQEERRQKVSAALLSFQS